MTKPGLSGGHARLLLAMLSLTPAGIATGAPSAPACTATDADTAVVRSIGEDFSLTLMDGRVLRLAGIDPVGETPTHPGRPEEARAMLRSWLAGRPVSLRVLAAVPDRWGRLPSLVFAPGADGGEPALAVGLAMIDAGLARRAPEAGAVGCEDAARGAETGARVAGLGLWDDPYYAVRHVGDGLPWTDATGGMVVVEGRVHHVGETRTRVYLDLGPTRGSLAVRLARRAAFILDQGGAGHSDWVGRSIRVRGVADDGGGPLIDVQDAGQIEVLDGPAPGGAQP